MAKKAYVGVNGLARKIKKGYIGVDGVARKIKKGYIGVGGVARPCWGEDGPVYYGSVENLRQARYQLTAASVGDYALFVGGYYSQYSRDTESMVADAYNSSLTRSNASNMTNTGINMVGLTVGNYALFCGGGDYSSEGSDIVNTIEYYNASLTHSAISNRMHAAVINHAGASIGDYAIIAGGVGAEYDSSSGTYKLNQYSQGATRINTSLTRTIYSTALSAARSSLAAASAGNYAIFAGGQNSGSSYLNTVEAFNSSMTRTNATALSVARRDLSGASIDGYAIFRGGTGPAGAGAATDVYDASLTRVSTITAGSTRRRVKSTTLGNHALFGGGTTINTIIESFSPSLTLEEKLALQTGRAYLAAATVGNYSLFGGGETASNTYSAVTEAFVFLE